MNPAPKVSTPESPRDADTRPAQDVDGRKTRAVQPSKGALSNPMRSGKPESRASTPGGVNADPRSVRPEVVVRVSVIDGADHLVYVDVGDRRGWKQPLAAQEVASELRHRPSATEGVSLPEPRTVRTLEMARPLAPQHRVDSMPVSKTPTPYSLGKASVSVSGSLSTQHQRAAPPSRAPALRAQATAEVPTRER